ncbi:hypothetical protein BGW39_005124 [Mortierella sp. 14UC]|nr:hypothetical protein BGW39_005124 [Mortierella sp. 14UC]
MTTSPPFLSKTRVWATSISLMAAIGVVHAQIVPTVPTVPTTTIVPPTSTATVPDTTTTVPTTSTTTTTTTTTTSSPVTISTTPSVSPTTTATPLPPLPPGTQTTPSATTTTTTSQSVNPSVVPKPPPTSNSSSSNLPVIVGSVAGAAALIIIIATTIICLRRKRRNNRDLTFDVLQGMSTGSGAGAGAAGAATSSRARPSQQHYRANALPPSSVGAYDDGYDYDSQVGGAGGQGGMYGHHIQSYDDTGYDAYGNPHHAYQNPSIFQEDSMAYSNNGRNGAAVAGYEQNLPEIVYRNGNDLIHPSGGATGYYEDDLYSQQLAGANNGWDNQNAAAAGGYIGPKGLWIANPTNEKQYHQQQQQYQDDMELQPPLSSTMTYEKNSITQYDSDTAVDSSSPPSKFRGHNPQALPESPRLQQLRGGDLFGQDGGSPTTPTSPRSANANASVDNVTRAASPPPASSSPRLLSRSEMRSFEMARHSPGRSSNDGVQSYANDLPSSGRPSVSDRPSMEGGNGGSNLNPNKSLRTLRREDW